MRIVTLLQLLAGFGSGIRFATAQSDVQSDCPIGTYFLPNDLSQQTCAKVGECLECITADPDAPLLTETGEFPFENNRGMYCAPELTVYDELQKNLLFSSKKLKKI